MQLQKENNYHSTKKTWNRLDEGKDRFYKRERIYYILCSRKMIFKGYKQVDIITKKRSNIEKRET